MRVSANRNCRDSFGWPLRRTQKELDPPLIQRMISFEPISAIQGEMIGNLILKSTNEQIGKGNFYILRIQTEYSKQIVRQLKFHFERRWQIESKYLSQECKHCASSSIKE